MAEKRSEILVKSGEKGLLNFMKVTAHSGCWEINFPFQAKCPLCFIDPYLLSHPAHSLGSQCISEPNTCRWNSEKDNRCRKNTTGSDDDRMWLCLTQLLKDLCIFERADSQLDHWKFEDARESMHAHERLCACVCLCVRVCVSECWICASLWRTRKDGEGANLLLCRLTLSFQTHLLSKPPTIPTVCPPPFCQYFPYPPTVPGILCVCVGIDKPVDVKAA